MGVGGFGKVFRGYNIVDKSKADVAIKIMSFSNKCKLFITQRL